MKVSNELGLGNRKNLTIRTYSERVFLEKPAQ